MIQKRTIGIIGAGNVGVAVAYAIFLQARANEIILIDKNQKKAEGEAMDLTHGQAFVEKTVVHAGDYSDIGGVPIMKQPLFGRTFDPDTMHRLFLSVRNAAYEIIDRKGNTSSAIGSVLARMVEVIMDDRRAVLPVSVRLTGQYDIHDICISIPAVLGRNGVEATIQPDLSAAEVEGLRRSAQLLKQQLADIDL